MAHDDNEPVTRAEFREAQKKTNDTLERILQIVQRLDEDKAEFNSKNIPQRVTVNEEDILKIKARLA